MAKSLQEQAAQYTPGMRVYLRSNGREGTVYAPVAFDRGSADLVRVLLDGDAIPTSYPADQVAYAGAPDFMGAKLTDDEWHELRATISRGCDQAGRLAVFASDCGGLYEPVWQMLRELVAVHEMACRFLLPAECTFGGPEYWASSKPADRRAYCYASAAIGQSR